MEATTAPSVAEQRAADEAARAELLSRIEQLQPLLANDARQADVDRRVPDASIDALAEAGVFRTMVPRRYGGYQGSTRTHLEVSAAVAEACGGTGWVVALTNVCAWMASTFGAEAQDDVFGADPDARVAGVLAPSVDVQRVDGGLLVSGKWFWSSGSLHATWGLLGVLELGADGVPVDHYLALIPMSELTIEDTWFTAGMRGSGSNCVVADKVFVPAHRLTSIGAALQGVHGTPFADEVAYRSAFVPVAALILVGPQLGMGRAALRYVIDKAAKRGIAYTSFERQTDSVAFQLQIAQAAQMVDTAHLHAFRAADDIDHAAERGEFLDYVTRARVRSDTGLVARQITGALDLLQTAHGASSFAEVNPLQQFWRDANTAARHAVVLHPVSDEVYGKALLGVDNTVTPLV